MCLSQANDKYPAIIHITRLAHVATYLAIKFLYLLRIHSLSYAKFSCYIFSHHLFFGNSYTDATAFVHSMWNSLKQGVFLHA